MDEEVRSAAASWLEQDPDTQTRQHIADLLARGDDAALRSMFTGRIGFGTAGLRAEMGPGPNQMNRLVVRQTTAGLMRWLPAGATVVIGFDARHRSVTFAHDTARMVIAAGGRAELLPEPLPTPVLAHAVLARKADAGVMITASHNPPADNGYKLYLADGIQLVAPADAEIAALIDDVASSPLEVVDEGMLDAEVAHLGPEIAAGHIQAALAPLGQGTQKNERDVSVVYTAMHGVGGEHILSAFAAAGFAAPTVVPEQFEPDPDFPTAAFPNPEEDGALDLALGLAENVGADVVLANDPDADRLAMAVPVRDGGGFVALSGDQLGVLLADHLLGTPSVNSSSAGSRKRIVASSHVSSRLLSAIAEQSGAECVTTLTGFKWVARPIVDQPDAQYVFGYEEAIGYCCGDRVRDKDGISAALVAAELIAKLKADGLTVWDRMDDLALVHGAYLTGPVTIRFDGAGGNTLRSAAMENVLAEPPQSLVGETLVSSENMAEGRTFLPATGLVLHYDKGTRVIVRPSGTEPKLKAYVEVIEASDGRTAGEMWAAAETKLTEVQTELAKLLGEG